MVSHLCWKHGWWGSKNTATFSLLLSGSTYVPKLQTFQREKARSFRKTFAAAAVVIVLVVVFYYFMQFFKKMFLLKVCIELPSEKVGFLDFWQLNRSIELNVQLLSFSPGMECHVTLASLGK